jgi:hypothetical protein
MHNIAQRLGSNLYYSIYFMLFLITINVPVVFMARYVMFLRGATSLRGALEGVGPENEISRVPFGPKKVEIFRAHPFNAPSNDVAHLKTIKYKRHKNNSYIGNFMYTSVVVLLCVRGVFLFSGHEPIYFIEK